MIQLLNFLSKKRITWLLLASTAFILESISLYLQHVLLIKPCVLCIYQRCALYGIFFSGLIGAILPRILLLRFFGLITWLYSAWRGLQLAIKHVNVQLNSSPFFTCDLFVSFPSWLPLDHWLPSFFSASEDCSISQWRFLFLEMPQWMIIIFSIYLIVAIFFIFAQFSRINRNIHSY
ncbi:disulfide bond formation protein DsbB [Sodalis sp. CWE]|uniref:disulfide bond formation protein DsbB n=1 Tax=Sodalis sp. CWE TaxID=2803816 RepID=UPI001C7DC960|nr:disulfide bond formation protein DsbB [Sodalis sp. CWE]MBX4181176.1 disulfide bond formation protein DsbB [Sodalis sp. CWE]